MSQGSSHSFLYFCDLNELSVQEFLKRLFPSVVVGEEEDWLSVFEEKVSEEGRRKEQELAEVRSREEEFSQNAENLRTALLSTVSVSALRDLTSDS